ncbi:hypothetical protein BHE74_00018415 [Ensete ventricosum]|nr:hypothetical protein BHE74_00018415 [Ensete ventricosum]
MAAIGSFLLPLCLFLAIASFTGSISPSVIQDACGRTSFPDLCIESLSQKPESQSTDEHGLAELAIRVAAEAATAASTYVSKVLEGSVNDSSWHQCLDDCSECYVDAVEQLDDCTGAMEDKGYANVNKWVSAAIAAAQTCAEACRDVALPDKATLTEMNTDCHWERALDPASGWRVVKATADVAASGEEWLAAAIEEESKVTLKVGWKRGWQWLGATAVEEGWQWLCGSDEGYEQWLCMAKEGQRRPMAGGCGHVDVWGSCCGRGDGDMVVGEQQQGGRRGGQQRVATVAGKGNGAAEEKTTKMDGLQAVEGWRRR